MEVRWVMSKNLGPGQEVLFSNDPARARPTASPRLT
jgi:hypothetical protein